MPNAARPHPIARRTRLLRVGATVSFASLMVAGQSSPALAQDQPIVELEQIDVQGRAETAAGPFPGYVAARSATASKTDTPLIETPQTISVVGRQEIQDRDATTLQQVLTYTPGVSNVATGRALVLDEPLVRGFDTSSGIGQFRDGLKLQANVYDGPQEPYGLERVEVLKGPASILYGQVGPGGIINSVSKLPTFTPHGEVNVTGGSFNDKQVSADVSGPVGGPGSAFAYRITGLARDSDTWINFVPDNRRYIAPALTWAPDERTSLTVLGYYQEVRTRFTAPVDAEGSVFRIPGIGRIPVSEFIGEPSYDKYNINSGAAGYLFEHRFDNDVKLTSKFRYYESQADWNYLTFNGIDSSNPNDPQILRGVSQRVEHSTAYTADNNLQYRFATGPVVHTALVGVDFNENTYDTHRLRRGSGGELDLFDPTYGVSLPIVDMTRDSGFKRQIDQVGVYFQDQMKIADKLVLLGGGRQDWAETQTLLYTGGQQPNQDDSAFTGRAGLVYLAPYGFAPYVSYSQSFNPVIAVLQGATGPTKPTTGEQYEGGVRWQSNDLQTLLTASVYTIDQKNVVTFDSDFNLRQIGLVRSQGVELEAKTNMGAWQFTASYAYDDARTIEDANTVNIGQQVALVPYHQAAVWAIRDFTGEGLRGFSFGAGAHYFGETNLPPIDNGDGTVDRFKKVPGYVLVDAVAKLDLGAIDSSMKGLYAQINATNLLDQASYSCASAIQGCNYGQPRTITGTLSYKW